MALYKRAGSPHWWMDFTVGGVRVRESTGRSNKVEAAEVEAAERRRRLDALQLGAKVVWSTKEAADRWLLVEGGRLRDARGNESRVRKLFGLELRDGRAVPSGRFGLDPSRKLHELSNEHLLELVEARKAEGNSGGTINRELALVQSILRFAGAPGRNVAVPQGLLFGPLRQPEVQRTRALTEDEELRLLRELDPASKGLEGLAKVRAQDQYDRVILLLDTGVRYDEGARLTWDEVDLLNRRVLIWRGKVGNQGSLAMTPRLLEVLSRRHAERVDGVPWVFPSRSDPRRPIGHTSQGIRAAMDRVGINAPHLVERYGRAAPNHVFRHTFATRLLNRGMDLKRVSTLLGHASVTTTERYGHVAAGEAAEEAARLLAGPTGPRADCAALVR